MKVPSSVLIIFCCLAQSQRVSSFAFQPLLKNAAYTTSDTSLKVSIGLGPSEEEQQMLEKLKSDKEEPIVEPDHELFRGTRLTDFDKRCDEWYSKMLQADAPTFMGKISEQALRRIHTLVPLERDPTFEVGHEEWSPYRVDLLPGSPILPGYGLEQYGLPIPRRNADPWRHFDVSGLIGTDYSKSPEAIGTELNHLSEEQINHYTEKLKSNGAWLDDNDCSGRLVYINGRYAPSLSHSSAITKNLDSNDFKNLDPEMIEKFNRLTDGFTDRLAADVPSGETDFLTSFNKLSMPHHNVGEPYKQFALNNQQGTACFVALNSVRAGCAAFVHIPKDQVVKPILIVNAVTANGGVTASGDSSGVAIHPRTLVTAEANSEVSIVQTYIDLDNPESEESRPKFVNGCTQMFICEGAKVKHSYLQESGGMVTANVEASDEDFEEGVTTAREMESLRKSLSNTHFESIDVHVVGNEGSYEGAFMELGGNGRSRIAISTSLLRPGAHASVNGFVLAGGAQRSDMRTNIHHIAQGCTSRQSQKNMIGGRATGIFKGRIRVEQSAQQTDSEQLARTILMTDKARAYAIPSLEIIADDVTCTHGATVSDLSEEELFYLRSRGVDRTTARNILMFGFVEEVASKIEKAVHGDKDDPRGLRNRIIQKLQNIVPKGEKTEFIGDEFQSV